MSAYFFGDVTTMAICIQTSGKPSVYAEFAFQLMCNDAANLDLIAFGLEVLDQCDGAVTIAQGGIEDGPASRIALGLSWGLASCNPLPGTTFSTSRFACTSGASRLSGSFIRRSP